MRSAGIIDTGAIIAISDADSEWHDPCLEALASLRLPLLTTEAVLTELFHLIEARNLDMDQAWGFVLSGALTVKPLGDPDLPAIHSLMMQYADRPMDFADATLVNLATRESLSIILTIDHDDFETYRIGGKKRFTILPSRDAVFQGR